MLGQVAETNRLTAITKAKEDNADPNDDHHNDGGHFDHRKPELNFTVQPNRRQVCQRH
ncbi:hypothetical protein D3C81_1446410 [compost metagenome]